MSEKRSSVAPPAGPSVRRFVLEQRIRYSYDAPVTDLRQWLRVVPPLRHGSQRRRAWDLTVSGVPSSQLRTSTDDHGNLTVRADVPLVEDSVEFVVRVEADVDTDASARPHRTAPDRRYLESTALTAADDRIARLARSGDPALISADVHAALAYEWGITGVHTTAATALAGGRGVCQDYAHIMLAACRSVGLPARYVSGHLVGEGGSHAWVEVLRPAPGQSGRWVAEGWDPTHDRRTDASYLVIAVGRDYADAAPMWGSYEGDGVNSTLSVDKRLSVPRAAPESIATLAGAAASPA